jgi:hypothetical protein
VDNVRELRIRNGGRVVGDGAGLVAVVVVSDETVIGGVKGWSNGEDQGEECEGGALGGQLHVDLEPRLIWIKKRKTIFAKFLIRLWLSRFDLAYGLQIIEL